MAKRCPKWLMKRGSTWYYRRDVPKRFAHLDTRGQVWLSCETEDFDQAIVARKRLNDETEAFWNNLVAGQSDKAHARYEAAVIRARKEGFAYRPAARLAEEASTEELLARINKLEEILQSRASQTDAARTQAITALLGGAPDPSLHLSQLVKRYEELTRDERLRKTEDQIRKWRNPRLRAQRNFVSVVDDRPLADLSRADALSFRAWLIDLVESENLLPESANKQIHQLGAMLKAVSERLSLGLDAIFSGLSLKEGEERKRPSFSTKWLRERLLAPGALAGMNEEARSTMLIVLETGARPVEIATLDPQTDLVLDHAVPHMLIQPAGRDLETRYSRRSIPLVGIAFEAAAAIKAGAHGRYKAQPDRLSAAVNKYLATNGLLESEEHSLYSLRHSFKDRLTDAGAPDLIDARLMGHKFNRPDYGRGPTLEKLLEWMEKVRVS